MALLDDLANPDLANANMSAFASPSPGGSGPPAKAAIPEGDQKTSPDGEPVYFNQTAGRYLTAPAYQAAVKIATPKVDPVEHKAAIARLTALKNAAMASQGYADEVNNFQALNKNTGTGGLLLGLVPHYADAAQALNLPGSKDLGTMEGDSIAAATARTKTISSRPAQMEFLKNLGAVPNVKKAGPANTSMVDQTNRVNQKAQKLLSFYDKWITDHDGTDTGVDEAWTAYADQHFDQKGNFSADPLPPRTAANNALARRSATSRGPVVIPLNP